MKSKNQVGLFDPEADYANKKIVIVWAGWSWSVASYYITQMWCTDVTVIDFDDVEIHNTASQFYKQSDIGKFKVDAMKENLLDFNWIEIKTFNEPYKAEHVIGADIVLALVDNMDVRKHIVDDCFDNDVSTVVETRMSGEEFMIFTFDPFTDRETWIQFWYPQSEVSPEVCTMKSISYNTGMLGSLVAKIVKNCLKWERVPFILNMNMSDFTFSSDY